VIAGSEKKDRSGIKKRERRITAYHEAGHALAAKIASPENTVAKITIIPSTKGAGGFCVNIPPDKLYYTKKELEAQIIVNLAGRASEELIFGKENVTTGASNDIEKATAIVRDYVTKYGMSDQIGLINTAVASGGKAVFDECAAHMDRLYQEAARLLNENLHKLKNLAETLLEKETLNEEEIDALCV
jgi:cell division protease FtsH